MSHRPNYNSGFDECNYFVADGNGGETAELVIGTARTLIKP